MKYHVTIIACLIVLVSNPALAQDAAQSLSMALTPVPEKDASGTNTDIILITISNSSATAITVGWDGDDYRIMLIDNTGDVFVPQRYPIASLPHRDRTIGTFAQVVPPHAAIKHILRLKKEIRQKILPGIYWLMVAYKFRTWSDAVLTAPAIRIKVE